MEATIEVIKSIVFFLPIAGLIWKAAAQSKEQEQLKHEVADLKNRLEEERISTDSSISTIINQPSDIKVFMARLEERLASRRTAKKSE